MASGVNFPSLITFSSIKINPPIRLAYKMVYNQAAAKSQNSSSKFPIVVDGDVAVFQVQATNMPPTRSSTRIQSGGTRKRKPQPTETASPVNKRQRTMKPYKVCDVSRTKRKGIVAFSLEDLRLKVTEKFDIASDEDFDIVLEDDCTVIDDQAYFESLKANTVLMVLKVNERIQLGDDTIDSAQEETEKYPSRGPQSHESADLVRIAEKLSRNLSAVVTLPDTEAQVIAEADRNELHLLLRQPMDIVRDIQHTCAQRLSDRQSQQNAMNLLTLYHRAKSQEDDVIDVQKRSRLSRSIVTKIADEDYT